MSENSVAVQPGHLSLASGPARGMTTAAGPSAVHLMPAAAAVLAACLLLFTVQGYVDRQLPRRLPLFATFTSPIKLTGNVLQTQAFRMADTLPTFGSSELDRPADNRPDAFFRAKPTGFSVFPVGRGGTTCLMILQKLAAAGPVVRGKKTAIFLSPTWFAKEEVTDKAVDANLTTPQLGAWMFGGTLSTELKRQIALRLQDYPDSLADQPLLTAALECLAHPTPANHVLFAAMVPLGKLQNVILARVEYCAIFREMLVYPRRLKARSLREEDLIEKENGSGKAEINWERLAAEAEARDRRHDKGDGYSATPPAAVHSLHTERRVRYQVPGSRDAEFVAKMKASKEWQDLALLIAGLKELRADAVFISQPYNGVYRDQGGTTPQGRAVYYEQLEAAIGPSGFPLRDYSDHEEDRYFFNDSGHPSAKAWIYYNRALDEFYHGIRY